MAPGSPLMTIVLAPKWLLSLCEVTRGERRPHVGARKGERHHDLARRPATEPLAADCSARRLAHARRRALPGGRPRRISIERPPLSRVGMILVRPAEERGRADFGWLDTRH